MHLCRFAGRCCKTGSPTHGSKRSAFLRSLHRSSPFSADHSALYSSATVSHFLDAFRFRGKRSDREETRAGACGLTGLPMRTHTYVHVSNVLQVSMCSNNVTQYRLAVNLYPTFYTIHLPLVDCHPIASFRWKKKMRFKLFA